ncbi:MAG TPA: hypothetical protein VKU00_31250 [Chthonomonadaceae bacterium]|nr:hypothetical protein [Chthonomonadaceae bacterium]
MKREISPPIVAIIAVVVVAIVVFVGWQWINREPTATNVGANGAPISPVSQSGVIPGQPTPPSDANPNKAGGTQMISSTNQ